MILLLLYGSLVSIQQTCLADDQENDDSIDYPKLIESLRQKNPAPIIKDRRPRPPVFAKQFDLKEQDRVQKAIETLARHEGKAWVAALDYLDDKSYCITVNDDDHPRNFTVGGVCRRIVMSTLTEAYKRHLPGFQSAYSQLSHPEMIPRENADLRNWGHEQHDKGRELYELQNEAAEWALVRVTELREPPAKEITKSVKAIEEELENLRKNKEPVLSKRFFGNGDYTPYR